LEYPNLGKNPNLGKDPNLGNPKQKEILKTCEGFLR
jgi:hypothetical protein